MPILALADSAIRETIVVFAAEEAAFQINLFWVVAQAASFLLFFVIVYLVFFRRVGGVLEERRSRIEQGLRDADQARAEREQAASERLAVLAAAREEANELLARGQRMADENRERAVTETRTEIERLRERAAADIEAEKQRALSEVREQVADLALLAAGRVVGETMNEPRERRLVEEFLRQVTAADSRRPRPPA